jgi:hypothetical protein
MLQRRQTLTAQELSLPQNVVDALIAIRDDLRDGKYPHRRTDSNIGWCPAPPFRVRQPAGPVYFNMAHWCVRSNQDRVCCLGGLVEMLTGYSLVDSRPRRSPVLALCYPPTGPDEWPLTVPQVTMYEAITPEQAADAIDNFLYEGHPHWERILIDA